MKKIIFLTLFLSCFIISAHAESYNFNDYSLTYVADYYGGAPAAVSSNQIAVSNTTGSITDLNVTISGIRSQALYDMSFVLVSPDNTGVVLSSFAGGDTSDYFIPSINLTFDDEADKQIKTSTNWNNVYKTETSSGTYQTSAYSLGNWYIKNGEYAVEDPITAGIFGDVNFSEENLLSAFDDISANGVWTLLAYDNLGDDRTLFTNWSLSFTTSDGGSSSAVPEPAEWALIILAACGICAFSFFNRNRAIN